MRKIMFCMVIILPLLSGLCFGQALSDDSMQASAADSSQDSAGASSQESSRQSAGASSEESSRQSVGASSQESSQQSSGASSQESSQGSIRTSSNQSAQQSAASSEQTSSITSTFDSFDYTTASSGTEVPDTVSLVIAGAVVSIGITAGAIVITVHVTEAREEEIIALQDQFYLADGKEYEEILAFFAVGERELIRANDELVAAGYEIESDQDAADYLAALMLRLAERSDKILASGNGPM